MKNISVQPFSAFGFFLGALFAATAAAVKIFLLKDVEDSSAARPA